jgi:uncharacterized protein (TIGR00369 family)
VSTPDKTGAHWRALERMYLGANVNRYFQPTVEIGEARARVTIPVQESSFHAAGALHGSVYFKALDDAAFFAAQSLEAEVFVLTATFEIEFLAPVTAGTLDAVGEVVERGHRTIATAVATVDGRQVARGRGEFARGRMRLDEVPGYAGD